MIKKFIVFFENDLNKPIDKPRSLAGSDWGSVQPVHFQPSLDWSRSVESELVKINQAWIVSQDW